MLSNKMPDNAVQMRCKCGANAVQMRSKCGAKIGEKRIIERIR